MRVCTRLSSNVTKKNDRPSENNIRPEYVPNTSQILPSSTKSIAQSVAGRPSRQEDYETNKEVCFGFRCSAWTTAG